MPGENGGLQDDAHTIFRDADLVVAGERIAEIGTSTSSGTT